MQFYTNPVPLNTASKLELFYHKVDFKRLKKLSNEKNDKSKSSE